MPLLDSTLSLDVGRSCLETHDVSLTEHKLGGVLDRDDQRWTPSTGQLINVAKWNLLRYIPVKMRGAEDDKAETAKSFTSL